jgi:peptidyl-prolyl cis-trans isomerase C
MKNRLMTFVSIAVLTAAFLSGCQNETAPTAQEPLVTPEPKFEQVIEVPVELEKEAVEQAPAAEVKKPRTKKRNARQPQPEKAETLETPIVEAQPKAAEKEPVTIEETIPAVDPNDEAAVIIDDLVITEGQLLEKIDEYINLFLKPGQKLETKDRLRFRRNYRTRIVNGLIAEILAKEQFKVHGITVTEEEVEETLQEMLVRRKTTLEEWDKILKEDGLSIEKIRQRLRKQIPTGKLLDIYVEGKINFSEEDVRAEYERRANVFVKEPKVRVSHILIQPDKSNPNQAEAKAAALKKAEQMLKRLQEGAGFAAMAKEVGGYPSAPRGGDLGFFERGRMAPEFEDAAFGLKNVGDISEIVETQYGYHIIKLTARQRGFTTPFEEVKDGIERGMIGLKRQELYREYIALLRSQVDIVFPPGKELENYKQ